MDNFLGSVMQHHRPWYAARKVQGAVVIALLVLLVVVLTGPRPKVRDGLLGDVSADAAAASSKSAGSEAAGGDAVGAAAGSGTAGGLVQVDFYGESLCPDCQHMVRDVLQPLFDNKVADLMHLTYHAFGNVKNGSDGEFSYQHGPNEGKYNKYILCSQHFHPDQREWFPYVKCLADKMHQLDAEADGCSSGQGWEPEQISRCAGGDQGKQLELAAAAATWALRPRHTFVPWIVVNGVALGGEFERLERYVCAAAPAAAPRPPACYELPEKLKHMG